MHEISITDAPPVDLEVAEAAPPGHEAVDQDDTGRKQGHPAYEDPRNHACPCFVCYDGACREA